MTTAPRAAYAAAVRIIAGAKKGHRIVAPSGDNTRPTGDRAREALFNMLVNHLGPLEGADVVDLFAGSGALGLEALSRGASQCVFVESGHAAARVIQANLVKVGLTGGIVQKRDALANSFVERFCFDDSMNLTG